MIAIVLLTCDRPQSRREYAKRTLRSLKKLRASEPIHLHIAHDGSAIEHHSEMLGIGVEIFSEERVTTSDAHGAGYGGSYNLAQVTVHQIADLVLPVEDDWELQSEFDVDPLADALRFGIFGCIRMGYIGWTQDLKAKFVGYGGLTWLALDPESAEPHVFAGHPRLETAEYEKEVGPWLENLDAGSTEFDVAHRVESRFGVAWPVDLIPPRGGLWAHIGSEKAESKGMEALA